MDKLSEHAIRMLEIVNREGVCNSDVDAIAEAIYDTILQVQMLKMADRKVSEKSTGSSCSEKPNNCKYAVNPSGDVWECGCCLEIFCEHQIYDRNPDGTLNIVECGFEPKTEPQTERRQVMEGYSVGEYIIYVNGDNYEIGRIKSVRDDGCFVAYHKGETGAKTPWDCIHKLRNGYCIKETSLGGEFFKKGVSDD